MNRISTRHKPTSLAGPLLFKNPAFKRARNAFLIAYAYVSITRIIGDVTRGLKNKDTALQIFARIKHSLLRSLQADKLPQFFAKLVLTYPFIEYLLKHFLARILKLKGSRRRAVGTTTIPFLAGLSSSYLCYTQYVNSVTKKSPTKEIAEARLDNISFEITALALARSIDAVVRKVIFSINSSKGVRQSYDVFQFASSCFIIMFSWFYLPHNMQPKYRLWITKMANMDDDLVTALRHLRNKDLKYGVTGPYTTMLEPTAVKLGLPKEYGNTNKTIPIPCVMVHANSYKSCEVHALWRFYRGMKSSMMIYLPLNVLIAFRQRGITKQKLLFKIVTKSLQSSAFLATFIALNWYSVCLVRQRLGPKLFPNATPQQLEEVWAPATGSLTCGLSILLEEPRRRTELALFVFAKAISIVLPNDLGRNKKTLDRTLFAASMAVLITSVKRDPTMVSGFFGSLLRSMF